MSVILITHNMGIVAEMCDRIAVMYGGVIVEEGLCSDVLRSPLHPYTKGLLACIPNIHRGCGDLRAIPGFVPRVFERGSCRFLSRCHLANENCRMGEPHLIEWGKGHRVRCQNIGNFEKGKAL